MALTDYDVRRSDRNEGILLANRFISHLELSQALGQRPARIQTVMVAYYGTEMTQEEVADGFKVSDCTVRS